MADYRKTAGNVQLVPLTNNRGGGRRIWQPE